MHVLAATCQAIVLAILIVWFPTALRAKTDSVDLLLVLATDTSSSVFQETLKQQRAAYATAMTSPRVLRAIRSGPHSRIAVTYVEWAGDKKQKTLVPWMVVNGPLAASAFAARLRKLFRSFSGATAIGSAIDYCVEAIETSPFQADRAVIDIAGDGTNNGKRNVQRARDRAVAKGIVINGLPTPREKPRYWAPEHTHPPGGLTEYYFKHVVGGPGSFAITADRSLAFRDALIRKFVAEIASR
jgi:hypothetical protein